MTHYALPNLAELLGPVLQRISVEQRPLVIAAAERMAANRYRDWSNQVSDLKVKSSLLACAEREDRIASQIEALFANSQALQQELLRQTPELTDSSLSVFTSLPLNDQLRLQAQGERIGAATWRSYAKHAGDQQARDVFTHCATLEEESALYLESIADMKLS